MREEICVEVIYAIEPLHNLYVESIYANEEQVKMMWNTFVRITNKYETSRHHRRFY